jgi:hypothetical protein
MTSEKYRTVRISVEVESEFRGRVKSAAAARGVSMCDYLVVVLRLALASENFDATGQVRSGRSEHPRPFSIDQLGATTRCGYSCSSQSSPAQIEACHSELESESWELPGQSHAQGSRRLARSIRDRV